MSSQTPTSSHKPAKPVHRGIYPTILEEYEEGPKRKGQLDPTDKQTTQECQITLFSL